jgi:lipid II:glycine glycyltransferase (peptidoglycan interpeptide bridge formation enzyme)
LVGTVHVEEVQPSQWSGIARTFANHNYENCPAFLTAQSERLGSVNRFFIVRTDAGYIGAAAVRVRCLPMIKRGIAYVSSGPLLNPSETDNSLQTVLSALKKHLVEKEGHILLVRMAIAPTTGQTVLAEDFATLGFLSTDLVRSYKTVLIELMKDETALRAQLHSKWRNMLNQSAKHDLSIEVGTDASFWPRFLRLFEEMKEAKEFDAGLGPEFFSKLDCKDAGTVFFIAQKDGKDIGSVVMSALGETAIYLFGATNTEGRDMRAGYFLIWSAMIHFKKVGCRYYDLGGIDVTTNHGGYQFKTRMGGDITDAAGPFQAVPDGVVGRAMVQALRLRQNINSKRQLNSG